MKKSDNTDAFEYVLGTLDFDERAKFSEKLKDDRALRAEVEFWEESLFNEQQLTEQLSPKPLSFEKIQSRISLSGAEQAEKPKSSWFNALLTWRLATAFSLVFAFSVLFVNVSPFIESPNTPDYVAVLLDENDEAVLTALTSAQDDTLLLRWENLQVPDGSSIQMWSQSRRDGEIRPLLVFDNSQPDSIVLDKATLRLIMDSSHLIMTKEELGGSAIDMPSDEVLAKGVCVRFVESQANT